MVSITDTGIRLISATGRPHLKHWADKQQPTIDPKARCELYTDISQKKSTSSCHMMRLLRSWTVVSLQRSRLITNKYIKRSKQLVFQDAATTLTTNGKTHDGGHPSMQKNTSVKCGCTMPHHTKGPIEPSKVRTPPVVRKIPSREDITSFFRWDKISQLWGCPNSTALDFMVLRVWTRSSG